MLRGVFLVRVVGLVSAFAVPAILVAQQVKVEKVPLRPISSIDGKDLYKAYCAQCHGLDAKGNGPRAKLKKPGADLTRIAANNHGTFVKESVVEYIMGTRPGGRSQFDPVSGKVVFMTPDGPADMPPWGFYFRNFWPSDPERFRLMKVADYLETLQVQ
jgi:mono/diheme cytochrome c family protein